MQCIGGVYSIGRAWELMVLDNHQPTQTNIALMSSAVLSLLTESVEQTYVDLPFRTMKKKHRSAGSHRKSF
jgi:hypothetical protein